MKKKGLSLKLELILLIINILILSALCIAVYYNGISLNCDSCKVQFESRRPITNEEYSYEIKITDIRDYYLETGDCYVSWDKNQGWIVKDGC